VTPSLDYSHARRRMVKEQIEARGVRNPKLLTAMGKIPRHMFVDPALAGQAYGDHPMTIGEGQTISQPFMVALMTDAMRLSGKEKVLEIGTGSGYQTAILASMCDWVYSIERLRDLSRRAQRILEQNHIFNVNLKVADGTKGWPDEAPF
jgi:protein-L-isoaspartate(D-aspartate) O-methyltransferase